MGSAFSNASLAISGLLVQYIFQILCIHIQLNTFSQTVNKKTS
jgi:hypothetical protein